MPAYKVTGGPCHWDLHLTLYVFLSGRYTRHHIGNPNTKDGRRKVRRHSIRQIRRLQGQFDDFFNPNKADGEWTLYEFPPCCNYHIDLSLHLPPASWAGLSAADIEQRLPEGSGILLIDRIGMAEHPYARLGGTRTVIDEESDGFTFAHELGHLLGLPDGYATPDVPELNVQGNGMSPEEEAAHRGHLMGKKDDDGEREIQAHEIQEIAQQLGMTCDPAVCCPDEEGRQKERPAHEGKVMEVPLGPGAHYFEAHTGASASFDLALETLGQKRLETFLAELDARDGAKH